MEDFKQNATEKMQKSFEALLHNFSKIRTGRPNPAILDDIRINYYGAPSPIKQLCNVSVPDARMMVIQPWDKTTLADIEKAILAANLGINPGKRWKRDPPSPSTTY
jgi:ribosome recycling factor